jgi:hypothetical protein
MPYKITLTTQQTTLIFLNTILQETPPTRATHKMFREVSVGDGLMILIGNKTGMIDFNSIPGVLIQPAERVKFPKLLLDKDRIIVL